MKQPIKLISTLLVLGSPMAAQATCGPFPNQENIAFPPSTIIVPESLAVGSLITSVPFSGPFDFVEGVCLLSPIQIAISGRFTTHAGLPGLVGVFQTGVPGVGMRVRARHRFADDSFKDLTSHNYSLKLYKFDFTSMDAEFYKLGAVTSGTLAGGSLYDQRWNGGSGRHHLVLNNAIRFASQVPTCDLAAGDVNRIVNLNPIQASALKDAPYAGVQHFELTATCRNAVDVTFSFAGTPANGNGSLFANAGTARGVDLWLSSNGATITPNGIDSARTVAVSGDRAVLPLSAAYHKNGTVSQGTLASTATVNITYN